MLAGFTKKVTGINKNFQNMFKFLSLYFYFQFQSENLYPEAHVGTQENSRLSQEMQILVKNFVLFLCQVTSCVRLAAKQRAVIGGSQFRLLEICSFQSSLENTFICMQNTLNRKTKLIRVRIWIVFPL